MPIPFFRPFKSLAVNTEICINEFLQPRLLPFIHNHHSDLNFQFVRLHDLAEALTSKETIALMKENYPFGNNTTNHQHFPQDRLIELTLGVYWYMKFMGEDRRPQRSRSWLAACNHSWKILTQIFYKASWDIDKIACHSWQRRASLL